METRILNLPLDKVRLDGGTQIRAEINQETVDRYADVYRKKQELPRPLAFFDGYHYWLADGFHRYKGHQQAGRKCIEIDVSNGSLRDAILYAVGANEGHGLERTNIDRRRAVEILLDDDEWGRWSNRQIAAQAAVSEGLVRIIKGERVERAERDEANHKLGCVNTQKGHGGEQKDNEEQVAKAEIPCPMCKGKGSVPVKG